MFGTDGSNAFQWIQSSKYTGCSLWITFCKSILYKIVFGYLFWTNHRQPVAWRDSAQPPHPGAGDHSNKPPLSPNTSRLPRLSNALLDRFLGPTLCHHSTRTLDVISFNIYFQISEATEVPSQQIFIWQVEMWKGMGMGHSFACFFQRETQISKQEKLNIKALRG